MPAGSGEGRDPADDLFLLVGFEDLARGATDATINGCGSFKHYASSKQTPGLAGSSGIGSLSENPHLGDAAQVELKSRNKIHFPQSTAVDSAAVAGRVPPRCLQLVALRYQHEVQLEAPLFQQLLHLFLDYVVQCRQAYEKQRMHCGLVGGEEHPSALATPEFCDFGDRLGLQELDSGGILIEFLSLVAIHDGRDRLRMQWSDEVSWHPLTVTLFDFPNLRGIWVGYVSRHVRTISHSPVFGS